jgi:RNA binding exosome subunit
MNYKEFLNKVLNLPINLDEINHRVSTYITDTDIERMFGKEASSYILLYSDLSRYKSINHLLPKKKDFKIILIEEKQLQGHWIAILRYGNTIEVFNSYGTKPSSELNLLSKHQKEALNENVKWLNLLLNKAIPKFNVIYNTKRFQKLKSDSGQEVNTCGRFVLLRILMFLYFNKSLNEFIKFMN